jgi:hypothetical protein
LWQHNTALDPTTSATVLSTAISTTHLVEIDLLHVGQRVPMQQPLPPMPYFVFVSRSEKRPITNVWPIALSQPLPSVSIPLLPGDEDVSLDL